MFLQTKLIFPATQLSKDITTTKYSVIYRNILNLSYEKIVVNGWQDRRQNTRPAIILVLNFHKMISKGFRKKPADNLFCVKVLKLKCNFIKDKLFFSCL